MSQALFFKFVDWVEVPFGLSATLAMEGATRQPRQTVESFGVNNPVAKYVRQFRVSITRLFASLAKLKDRQPLERTRTDTARKKS